MESTNQDAGRLVLTIFLGAVEGSLSAVLGLAAAKGLAPWAMTARHLEAGAAAGGVLGAGLAFVLGVAVCALLKDRPYSPAWTLLIPVLGGVLVGGLVFGGNLAFG